MRINISFAIAIISALTANAPAHAQQLVAESPDSRWTAWLGCWQQLEESVREGNIVEPGAREAVPTKGIVVCVSPTQNPAAVTLSTIMEKQAALEETVVADGSSQPIEDPGCTGSQSARWSENGRRLYARAELKCSDGATRTISGVATMAPGPVWVDIQVVNVNGQESIRVRRYRRSPDQSYVAGTMTSGQIANSAVAAARQAATFTLGEVKEAVTKVTPSAVEAALIETNASFPLNAKRVQELDAAGVPDRLLDLMIALSFPHKFVVERRARAGSSAPPIGGSWLDPWGTDMAYYGYYDLFPYYYAPFGYGAWGRYDYYYYGAPGSVAVMTDTEPQPSGAGRVVDGLGYTRVRSREPQPTSGGMGMFDSGGGGSSSGGSSSGGGVSTQGYSGGGGDSGRTAVPRPPG